MLSHLDKQILIDFIRNKTILLPIKIGDQVLTEVIS